MKRFGQVIRIKPEGLEIYKRYHKDPWPEVNRRLKESHIRNYSIYLKDDLLFAYFEYTGDDYEKDMEELAADPVTQKWWEIMVPLLEPLATRKEGELWADMEEVYHLD